jgi:hypothetical protein
LKTRLESDAFRAVLPGWGLRGVLCAATSAIWAAMAGFTAPVEIAGMVAGVAWWVVVFAAACAWPARAGRWPRAEVDTAVKWAAWLKAGSAAIGWLGLGGAVNLHLRMFEPLGALCAVDLVLGLGALTVVAWLAGVVGPEQVAAADSFCWTALATLIEGAAMALVIAAIGTWVWLARHTWPMVKARWLALTGPAA